VFDMDGLLVDSEPLWQQAEIAVFASYGVALTEDLCRSTKGMFVYDVARHWYARHPWTGPAPEAVAEEILRDMERRLADEARLLPGAGAALAFCRARAGKVALASSSPRRLIDVVVERFALGPLFDVVHSAESEPAGKPDPAVFLTTARLLGVEPGGCVVLEDSPAGVAAALSAGMACVAVPEVHGGESPELFAGATVVLASLDDLDEEVWRRLEARVASPPSGGAAGHRRSSAEGER